MEQADGKNCCRKRCYFAGAIPGGYRGSLHGVAKQVGILKPLYGYTYRGFNNKGV